MLSVPCAETRPCRGDAHGDIYDWRQQLHALGCHELGQAKEDIRRQLNRDDDRKGDVDIPVSERLGGTRNIIVIPSRSQPVAQTKHCIIMGQYDSMSALLIIFTLIP